jgi:hypothetical protein
MAEITRPMIARWRPRGRAARRERSTALGADNIASSVLSQLIGEVEVGIVAAD